MSDRTLKKQTTKGTEEERRENIRFKHARNGGKGIYRER